MSAKAGSTSETVDRTLSSSKLRIFALDLVLILVSLIASVLMGQGSLVTGAVFLRMVPVAAVVLFAAVVLLRWRQLYRINPRYVGLYDVANISFVCLLLGLVEFVAQTVATGEGVGFRVAVPPLFVFTSISLLTAVRLFRKTVWQRSHYPQALRSDAERILIIGAGDAGEAVWRELNRADRNQCFVIGYLDDDVQKHGSTIHGVEVLGGIDLVPEVAEAHEVAEIIIAVPSANSEQIRRIFNFCTRTKARIRTLPSYATLLTGEDKVLPMMRELELEDLLRRDSVDSDMSAVEEYLEGERVMITGAGGSIGSELARQVASVHPASLVLLGRGENSVFEIDQELRHTQVYQPTAVVCDVKDKVGLSNAFKKHYPSVVIHAAAHKHVPLMEAVPIEAIMNNVFGTLNAVEESVASGVKKFILVSTDKAVKPGNVMGATKRLCEMIVSSISTRSDCSFAAVRFGNVLGSRGSLVPILKKQINRGGPVTITHPEMTRYFMTIPEAVQLILQAGSMGNTGEIFILDMGQPVKIVDLVNDMIRMHGLVPGQDIEIQYTGARPGEKLHEELASDEEDLKPCDHDKIRMVADDQRIDWTWLREQLMVLRSLCEKGDEERARELLMELAWGKNIPPVQTAVIDRAAVVEDTPAAN